MKKAKLITLAVLAILVGIVILQNVETVDTKILFITLSMPRAVLLALTWVAGLVTGLLIALTKGKEKKAS